MPPSVFRGRVVAEGEPLWLDTDRDEALALLAEESATCECGEPRDVSMALESDGAYAGEVVICHACAALSRAARDFGESHPNQGGVMARIKVRPRGEAPA